MWPVILAVLLLFLLCAAYIAVGLGWIPFGADFIQSVFDWGIRMLKKYVVNQRPELVAAIALVACLCHSLALSYFPVKWMHFLRADGVLRYGVSSGWAAKFDALMHIIRSRPATALILKFLEFLAKLATLPLVVGARLAFDPQNSRITLSGLFAPVAVAVVGWAILDIIPDSFFRLIPPGFLDSEGTGRDKEKIVWVSAGVLVVVGVGFEVARRWVAPDLAQWAIGRAHPLAFQWGLAAAAGASLVLAGLHLDGNLFESPRCDVPDDATTCANGEAAGATLVVRAPHETAQSKQEDALMAQSLAWQGEVIEPQPPPEPLQPRVVHIAALFVSCAAVVAMHIALPVFNRREFAVIATLTDRDP